MIFDTTTWEEKIVLLREHKRIHGHLRGLNKTSSTLTRWTSKVRKYKNSLTPEQVRQLEEVGFIFESKDERWKMHIKDLLE
jgi:hypothetical protein